MIGTCSGYTARYQKVHQTTSTGGSNTSTGNYGVVPKILNNRQVFANGTRSSYTANNNKNDNAAYLGNISATVDQGEISANNGELSVMKKKKTKTMDINEAHYKMGHMGEVALRNLLNHHNIKATGKFEDCI
jgi:hypothetical protein